MNARTTHPTEEGRAMAKRSPVGALSVCLLAMGTGTGIVSATVVAILTDGLGNLLSVGACGVALMGWGVWVARSRDSEIRQILGERSNDDGEGVRQPKESHNITAKPPLYRRFLRGLATPINAYRVPMPSDEDMGLTPKAERQFRGPAEEALAAEVRTGVRQATVRADQNARLRRGNHMEQEIARSMRGEESYQADADWLTLAYNRLAAGSTSAAQVRSDWERRKAR